MTKKLNITSITNELEESAFFHSKPRPATSPTPQPVIREPKPPKTEQRETIQQNASIPENQNAGIMEIQHNTTATEKVTYRFHPAGKYAIEDIKTTLARKVGIKASYELIAEEAILIAYEDLLENQHASKLAKRLSRMPENKKPS
jgi:hypothetical protein